MSPPLASLVNVSKFYGNVMGLNDFSVEFPKGMTGLLGPNGAGKSTMMKVLTGQIRPSKGRVEVLGHRPWDNPVLNRMFGYCPEQDTFFRGMTGLQFVTFSARLNGHSQRESSRLAWKVVKRVNLKKDANRAIDGYSKGMRQRIKIAQALVDDPQLLFLDEPLSGTDPIGRVQLMDLLHDLAMEGKDIIVSSHVLYEIERLTSNIVLVNKGRLVAEGNMHDIRDSMDKFPLTVRIRTKERKRLAKAILDLPSVSSIFLGDEPTEVLVRSSSPVSFFPRLQNLVVDEDIQLSSIDSPDDNLDAIFKYLVS
ncbi:MAG: ABC transporter ATP-binding protein [Candidatus Thermoplasmatota archaeon]|nr:ABC transporter ATP-binding protein [Candidatus Thermoplasmatota archaeon]